MSRYDLSRTVGKQFAGVVSLIISDSEPTADLKTIGTIDYLIDSAVAAGFSELVLIFTRACYSRRFYPDGFW